MIEKKLNPKQQAFADYYIEIGSAYQAAIKAGYSENYAKGNVVKLLENVSVKSYIENRMQELQSERVASQQEILESLTAILRGEKKGTALVGMGLGEQSVRQVQPTVGEKIRAAELLGKRYKLFTDKVETEITGAVQFIDDIGSESDGG